MMGGKQCNSKVLVSRLLCKRSLAWKRKREIRVNADITKPIDRFQVDAVLGISIVHQQMTLHVLPWKAAIFEGGL